MSTASTSAVKARSPFHSWMVSQFGADSDNTPSAAMARHCRRLFDLCANKKPPVRLSQIAATLGIEPRPILAKRFGASDGALDLESGTIILRSNTGRLPSRETEISELFRVRFTYAHELAHAIFYDCTSRPLRRLAPPATSREEEEICNNAARWLLMPDALMPQVVKDNEPSLGALFRLIQGFDVNLQPAAYRLQEWTVPNIRQNQFWMVSRIDSGSWPDQPPRCVTCFISKELKGLRFLAGGQRLDRISCLDKLKNVPWSLQDFFSRRDRFNDDWDTPEKDPHDELLQTKTHVVHLRSRHRWINWGQSAWTKGTIEIERDLRIQRKRPFHSENPNS